MLLLLVQSGSIFMSRVAWSVKRLARGWTVRESNPGGGEIFRTCPDRPWGLRTLLYNGYRVFPGGKERPGRDADSSPPCSPVGHERVELYLYSTYGPYGLCRASVPVQGCTLTLRRLMSYMYGTPVLDVSRSHTTTQHSR